jgi:Putative MetA-pathway of phenol degradation
MTRQGILAPRLRRARQALLAIAVACLLAPAAARAGPPYATDDPEPVAYRHWEFYFASQDEFTKGEATGTAPHAEANFGAAPDLHLHLQAQIAYVRPSGSAGEYGFGDVELGAKFRFLQEDNWRPTVGTFPAIELPTGSEARGLGSGRVHAFIPIWLQRRFEPWTVNGGAGYWINPGAGNRNYWFAGVQAERRVSKRATLGGEIFHTTPDQVGGDSSSRFNLGAQLDISERHHLLLSAGRGFASGAASQCYVGYQLAL